MEPVGEIIRRRRVEAGLSQQALAGEEFTASYVSMIEAGKRRPNEEALRLFARRLRCSADDLRPGGDPAVAELELAYAKLAKANGEPAAARTRLEELLTQPLLPLRIRHEALIVLAEVCERVSDHDASVRALRQVWGASVQGRSAVPVAEISNKLCWAYMMTGDFAEAVRVGELGLQASAEAGLQHTLEHLKQMGTLMAAHLHVGNPTVARAMADDLIRTAQEARSAFGQGAAYWNSAIVAEAAGHVDEAARLAQRALALLTEQGETGPERNAMALTYTFAELVMLADPGRAPEAARLLDQSLPGLRDVGGDWELGIWLNARAIAHHLTGNSLAAEQLARQALDRFTAEQQLEVANTLITLGDALVGEGDRDEGIARYHEAVGHLPQVMPAWKRAHTARAIAYRMSLAGCPDEAGRLLELALDAYGTLDRRDHADVAFGRRPAVAANAVAANAVAADAVAANAVPHRVSAADRRPASSRASGGQARA